VVEVPIEVAGDEAAADGVRPPRATVGAQVRRGAVAGTIGTAALQATTHLDIAVTGRPPSPVPAVSVRTLSERFGLDLGGRARHAERVRSDRAASLGELLGAVSGAVVGGAYGLVRSRWQVRTAPATLLLAAGAMALANTGAVRLGGTDPRGWTPVDWVRDVVPHLVYGWATAVTFDALDASAEAQVPA
jgi:hypothetical protein